MAIVSKVRCLTVLLAALATPSAASAQETTLRAGVFLPLHINFGEPFKHFTDKVNAEGKGKIQVRVIGGPEAVPPFELGNAVRTGVLDMAAVPTSYYKGTMVETDAGMLTDMSIAEQRASGAWALLNKLHNEKMNAHQLSAYGDGVQYHIYLTRVIDDPAQLKGLKLRVAPNYQAFFTSLGAIPVVMPPGDIYTALERGVIDGYGWPLWGIQDQSWQKHTKLRINPGFYNVTVNILVNLDKWKSLTDAQRTVLTETAAWFEADFRERAKARNAEEAKLQEQAGVKTVDFGPDFEKQANDVYWEALARESPENIKKLKGMLTR